MVGVAGNGESAGQTVAVEDEGVARQRRAFLAHRLGESVQESLDAAVGRGKGCLAEVRSGLDAPQKGLGQLDDRRVGVLAETRAADGLQFQVGVVDQILGAECGRSDSKATTEFLLSVFVKHASHANEDSRRRKQEKCDNCESSVAFSISVFPD